MRIRGYALACVLLSFSCFAGSLPGAQLAHQWTFNGFPTDSVGEAHGFFLGGATIENDRLYVDGIVGTRFLTRPLGQELGAKTLVAWVSPSNTFQKGGSVLTVENNANGDVFDGIVYAEQVDGQWMAGSEFWQRSVLDNGGAPEILSEPDQILVAIVYAEDGSIQIYRNGELYADATSATKGTLVTFPASSMVQIGARHGTNPSVFDGWIDEARIYDGVLDAGEVQDLYDLGPETLPNEPPPEPTLSLLHQWTFEDDTADDSVGQAHGQLFGGTAIADGRLYIDGTPASRMLTGPLGEAIGPRTLISWVSLATLSPLPGSILTIENNANGDVFDGIVYAERVPGQWMAGSNGWSRSVLDNGGLPETAVEPERVMLAIAYAEDNTIAIYRDGALYADPAATSMDTLVWYGADSVVQIGARHGAHEDVIKAWIDEARIYDGALDGDAIRDIYEEGPAGSTEAPLPPTNLVATGGNEQVSLAWLAPEAGPAPTGYEVFRGATSIASVLAPTMSYEDGDEVLIPGTPYCYTVRSKVVTRTSAPSNESCGTPTGSTEPVFHRGDSNADGQFNITDGIYVLNFLFLGGPTPPCLESANPNDDLQINITDGIYILNFLFLGGPEPASPGPGGKACGPDPTGSVSNLGCESYTDC
jgi:hypothetical protein